MSNRDLGKQFVAVLLDGCGTCRFDEAEGGLEDHCDSCCRKLTALAHQLFVVGGAQIECNEPKPILRSQIVK